MELVASRASSSLTSAPRAASFRTTLTLSSCPVASGSVTLDDAPSTLQAGHVMVDVRHRAPPHALVEFGALSRRPVRVEAGPYVDRRMLLESVALRWLSEHCVDGALPRRPTRVEAGPHVGCPLELQACRGRLLHSLRSFRPFGCNPHPAAPDGSCGSLVNDHRFSTEHESLEPGVCWGGTIGVSNPPIRQAPPPRSGCLGQSPVG